MIVISINIYASWYIPGIYVKHKKIIIYYYKESFLPISLIFAYIETKTLGRCVKIHMDFSNKILLVLVNNFILKLPL